ncbi:MAG: glycoside hydrolase family 3 C-terminal domain-containing protein [Bacteroidota bacterium]
MRKPVIISLSIVLFTLTPAFAQYEYAFQNPEIPMEERIDNLLSLMTLDEKVSALSTNPGVPRLGVVGTGHVEGLHGLAKGGPSNWGQQNPAPTTIFPQAIGLAESWDRNVLHTVASIEGYEVRYMLQSPKYTRGGLVVRAPNADIGRDIRWGRTEECFGEDAWFNAELVVSFIEGLQGDHSKYWQTASLMKHFLANSNENGRDSTSSDFGERLFREYYSYPFYKGITAGGSKAYMAAYNAVNGIPATVHPLLEEITVEEWGQNGIICTDGGAYTMLLTAHNYYPDKYKAAAACVHAGINQFLDDYREGVYGALANGYLTEEDLDDVLHGVYRVMIKLGQLDPPEMVPYRSIGLNGEEEPWLSEDHKKAALEVTKKTVVLLKNENNTLPLKKEKIKRLAVIGPFADTVLLDWYSGTPPYIVSPLQGIKNKVGDDVIVEFAPDNSYNKAVEMAQRADMVIMVVGNHPVCYDAGWKNCPVPSDGKEAVDRKVIELEQEDLIKRVYDANQNMVVTLISSFPYSINWTDEHVSAILHMTHCSQETGNALADVLFGDYNPGGSLVQTWPKSIDALPDMMDYDITNGRTYMYFEGDPLYEFGYGLSYTTFDFSNLKASGSKLKADGSITVSVDLKNTGKYAGDEVVQLYVQFPESNIERPNIALKGFERVSLKPGEKKKVEITLKAEDLAFWDETIDQFVVEEGKIDILIGASCKDIKLKDSVEVTL